MKEPTSLAHVQGKQRRCQACSTAPALRGQRAILCTRLRGQHKHERTRPRRQRCTRLHRCTKQDAVRQRGQRMSGVSRLASKSAPTPHFPFGHHRKLGCAICAPLAVANLSDGMPVRARRAGTRSSDRIDADVQASPLAIRDADLGPASRRRQCMAWRGTQEPW